MPLFQARRLSSMVAQVDLGLIPLRRKFTGLVLFQKDIHAS